MSTSSSAEPGTRHGYPVCTRAEASILERAIVALRAIEKRASRTNRAERALSTRWAAFLERDAARASDAVWQVLADAAIYLESPQARAAMRRHDERS